MDPEETMVEEEMDNVEADDALPDDVAEEEDSEDESLESVTAEDGQPEAEPTRQEPQATEPGWIKQRVNKAVERAVAQTEARMRAEFERQMAPLREKMLTDEARELVRQGEFKSLERAKEYLQLKQGVPGASTGREPQPQDQPRNERGQFQSHEDAATSARIEMLRHQADRIRGNNGPDVIAEFQNNEDIKKKVIAGEMDFYDVAEAMKSRKPGRKPPSPMRSPNGASGNNNPNAIDTMSDEQFERMEKRIAGGARIRLN